jgi:hypothetical protein
VGLLYLTGGSMAPALRDQWRFAEALLLLIMLALTVLFLARRIRLGQSN